MKDKFLIVADDFTGSSDTGVQLRRRGYPTKVMFVGGKISTDDDSSIVVDTETRNTYGEHAQETVSQSIHGLDFNQFKYVIKKVDSTLRGNIANEVFAVDEAFKPDLIICAPALPNLGRTTVHGVQRLNDVEICQTELAKDPKAPVLEDNLMKLLNQVYKDEIQNITLDELRDGKFSLTSHRIIVCDATLNSDLQTIIEAVLKTGKKVLWIGTAGIVDNMMEVSSKALPSFGIVASVSTVTNKQIKYCEAAGLNLISIPIHDVLDKKVEPHVYVEAAIKALKEGKDTILLTSTAYDREELKLSEEAGKRVGMDLSAVGDYTRSLIGNLSKEILSKTKVSGIFVTGGDTALGVLMNMKADGAEILSEILVGIPMVRVNGGDLDGVKLVSKAGAFGAEDAISFAMRKLKEKA